MIFFVLILLFLIFNSAKFAEPNKFMPDYISRDKTNAIKGIFVVLILFSHGKQNMILGGIYDDPYTALQNHLHQMVVAMFLFYSGFGIMESIKKRGYGYVKSIPTKRFPSVFLNFNIAIILFLILGWYRGKSFDIKTILLSTIGWESLGNSNWYMFTIFVLYIFTFLAFFYTKRIKNIRGGVYLIGILILTGLTIGLVYFEMVIGQDHYWYDSAILFVLGFYYSYFKDTIEKILMKNDMIYFSALLIILAVYMVSYNYRWKSIEIYTVWAVAFTLGIVVLTMKISIENRVLDFLGRHVFGIYILQKIPQILFADMGLAKNHKYAYMILTIAATIVLTLPFDYLTGKLNKAIWKDKKPAERLNGQEQ